MNKIQEEYKELLKSGMFWEFFPELSGDWSKDEIVFTRFYNRRASTDYIEVAEELYYLKNPTSTMDVPSSVYKTVEKWYSEWLTAETELEFFDWCLINKK